MKTTLSALVVSLLIASPCMGHVWQSYGPTDMSINNCYFHVAEPYYNVLCTANSILIDDTQGWHEFSYSNLPVWDALHLNADSIMVVLGDGSWSDGIWAFNRQVEEFQILEWCVTPHFIVYSPPYGTYYVGHAYGVLKSTNGTDWESVPYFDWNDCIAMACWDNHLVVSTGSTIHYSSDGTNWDTSPGAPYISDMLFLENDMLFGIFPDNSYSSGLWSSADFGAMWNVEFWWVEMSSVGIDCNNTLFVGWEEAVGGAQRVAIWVPELADLTFIGDGLPNASINKIKTNHLVDCPSAICCTDSGAYFVTDYLYPTILGAELINPTTGRLTWNVIPGAAYYDFYRSTIPFFAAQGTPWLTISELPPELDFTCGIGDETTNYYFLTVARNEENEDSHESNIVGEIDFALEDGE